MSQLTITKDRRDCVSWPVISYCLNGIVGLSELFTHQSFKSHLDFYAIKYFFFATQSSNILVTYFYD